MRRLSYCCLEVINNVSVNKCSSGSSDTTVLFEDEKTNYLLLSYNTSLGYCGLEVFNTAKHRWQTVIFFQPFQDEEAINDMIEAVVPEGDKDLILEDTPGMADLCSMYPEDSVNYFSQWLE